MSTITSCLVILYLYLVCEIHFQNCHVDKTTMQNDMNKSIDRAETIWIGETICYR